MNYAPPRQGIPLRPDWHAQRDATVGALVRSIVGYGRTALAHRAATAPTMTTDATALSQATAAFLSTLVGYSAAADLLQRGIALQFDKAGSISVPGITPGESTFVAEGAPFPVRQLPTTPGATLTPFKFGTLTSLTGEMLRSASAEALIRQALIDSTGPGLDRALFSNAAAVAQTRPAGLLNGITPLTPAPAGAKTEAMNTDLIALGSAVSVVAGKSSVVFVMAAGQAIAIGLRALGAFEYAVLPSSVLAPGTVIAVAVNALASAVEGAPTIETSSEAIGHEEDATAASIVTPGGQTAHPVRSYFQTDSVSLKMRWPISWLLRDPRGVAYMTGVNW
jgi:Phage capsid family